MKKSSMLQKLSVLGISLMLCSSQAINGAIPQMREALHISQSQTELLGTLPSLTMIIFILFSSFIANKIGMKKTIIGGLILAGIGGVLPTLIPTYGVLFASRLLLGVGLGAYNPLAVSYISALYQGDERATMLGWRASTEGIGQTVLIFIAGLFLNLGWSYSFLAYLVAFPLAFLFAVKVPGVTNQDQEAGQKERMNPSVYLLVLFAILLVMDCIAVSVRFSSIAAEIMGADFNASNYLAIMPILGIAAGFVFGAVNKVLKTATMYLGIAILIVANLLIAISNGNFTLLLVGLFLSSIPGSWCFPFIFNRLDQLTTKNTINLATSLVFVGCNIGNFIAPIAMQVIQSLTGTNALTAPFYIFAALFVMVLLVTMYGFRKHT